MAARRKSPNDLLLFDVIRRLRPLHRRLARSLAGSSSKRLPQGRRNLLERLHQAGPQSVPQIARAQGLGRQFVQRLVNAALADGLVETQENPAHKRSALVALTPAGRTLVAGLLDREQRALREVAAELDASDLEATLRVLGRLAERFPASRREGDKGDDVGDVREAVAERVVPVGGRSARVFVGGHGQPLLLVHGAWGGAELHFRPVWDRLAERFRVIAPDLPGFGDEDRAHLADVGAYARWLADVCAALDVPSAWIVGSSFGAAIAARLASDRRDLAAGLVLVNGAPLAPMSRPLKWVSEVAMGRGLVRSRLKKDAFGPQTLERAFVDPSRAPAGLARLFAQVSPPALEALVDLVVAGGPPASYAVAPLVLWGEDDRLPGTELSAARKLASSWPGASLVRLARAGHLPQLEQPAAFVEAIDAYIATQAEVGAAE
jgi:2-hydroxy-6-oxonona-2,4-dienedioate hydrolase